MKKANRLFHIDSVWSLGIELVEATRSPIFES